MAFVLGCLAPFVWAVMYYANYVVQTSGVIAVDQRVGPRLGYVTTDWAVLRENYDTVLGRTASVWVPFCLLWLGVLLFVYFARRWAREVTAVLSGPWMMAFAFLWMWSISRGGVPGVLLMLRPELRGYRPSGGIELYATFQCGLAISLSKLRAERVDGVFGQSAGNVAGGQLTRFVLRRFHFE